MEEPKLIDTKHEFSYEKLDGNITNCLTTIIEKLKKGQMSVMIGAGFSKNANPAYPNWEELLVPVYCELQSISEATLSTDKRKKIEQEISKNPSKIAQEYIDMKGRREDLDIYIENFFDSIEHDKTNYLELHETLLSLNWYNIITTNWDTLLEQANSKKDYELVKTAKDLSKRNHRLIIKIHGSLRTRDEQKQETYGFDDSCDGGCYIITTEDYNTYQALHTTFSKFMEIQILQNSFCLIGFSGNDPNFKYWIKELKRTMTKGGNTEEPNPIFFIDTSTEYPDPATLQYYKNNYIVRISLDESVKYIKGNPNKIKTTILDENYYTSSTEEIGRGISEKLLLLFKYIAQNTDRNETALIIAPSKYNDILKAIAYKDINTSSDVNATSINTLPIFYFNNLYYSDYIITYMRNALSNSDTWTENEYLAVYNLCVNNYYTISNIYEQSTLEKIIENYNKNILPEKKALFFLQQILKSDRHHDEENTKLKNYCDAFSKIDEYKNILTYEKALRLYDDFEYEELQKLLDNWKPEKDKNVDALSILKRIGLLLAFDNIMSFRFKKEELKNLLDIAEQAALKDTNKQILLFIKYCRQRIRFIIDYLEPNDIINQEISELKAQGYKLPYEYVEALFPKPSDKQLKPNEDIRYSRPLIQYPDPKESFPVVLRIFNFIEYTGIPAYLCLTEIQLFRLIHNNRNNEYCLYQILLISIPFFGNSSSEDTLRIIIPSILRYIKLDTLKELYNKILRIIKYKIDKTINPTIYVYIMTEIIKRLPQSKYTDYISYIIEKIEERNCLVISCITSGQMWGWKKPFLEILKRIDSFADYKKILIWIMEEFLEDCKELSRSHSYSYGQSEFFPYYFALITDNKFINEKKKFFTSEKGKRLIAEDMQYTKKLTLYAYDYVGPCIQNELISYFEKHYTIQTDPYFITKLKTDKLKNRCLNLIKEYDVKAYSSLDYSLLHLVKALNASQLLNDEDKKTICRYIADKYKILQENIDYFKHDPYKRYINLQNEFFLIIAEILTKKQLQKDTKFNKIYTELEKTYKAEKSELLEFKWLYTDDLQKFKQYFLETLSCFSYLHLEKQYLPITNICLSKVIVQDSAEFEAVLEQFINVYKGKYGNSVFENETTTGILIQILTKFRIEIPFCYDDLFIKAQMQRLAKYMDAVNIKDEVIDYWLDER